MKRKVLLLVYFLLGIGSMGHTQEKNKPASKPVVENGKDAIPIVVTSKKKARKPPPPPPPIAAKEVKKANELPPPPAPPLKSKADVPKADAKEVKKLPAPPKKAKADLPANPDAPPPVEERA